MSDTESAAAWVECFDTDGTPYYYNTATGKATWHKPLTFEPKRDASHGLPPGWEIHYDEEGTPYFFNPELRKSTWSAPPGWTGPQHMTVSVERAEGDGSSASGSAGSSSHEHSRHSGHPYSAGVALNDRKGHRQTSSAQLESNGSSSQKKRVTGSVRDRIKMFQQSGIDPPRAPTPERQPRHEKSASALPRGASVAFSQAAGSSPRQAAPSTSASRRERMQSMSNKLLQNLDAIGALKPSRPGARRRSQTSNAAELAPASKLRRPVPAPPRTRSPSPSPSKDRRDSGEKVRRLSQKLSPVIRANSPSPRNSPRTQGSPRKPARPPPVPERPRSPSKNSLLAAGRPSPPVPRRAPPSATKPDEPKPARPMSPKPKKKMRFSLFSGKKKDKQKNKGDNKDNMKDKKEGKLETQEEAAEPTMDIPELSASQLPEEPAAIFPYQYSGTEGEYEGDEQQFKFNTTLPAPPPFFNQPKRYLSSWGGARSFGPQPLREAGAAAVPESPKSPSLSPVKSMSKRQSMPPGRLVMSRGVSDGAADLGVVPEASPSHGKGTLKRAQTQAPAMGVSPALDAASSQTSIKRSKTALSSPRSPIADQDASEVKFQKGDLLGKGGFGRVYRAIDLSTANVFAVKEIDVVKGSAAENQESMDAFQQEVELMQRLDHPNVVRYLGVQTSERVIRVFLELAQGSLVDIIKKFGGSLHEKVIRKFTAEILVGLAYLHGEGVVHRDIKGSNILMGTDGHLKLADFGASKHYGEIISGQALKSIVGTPFWMAPEVVKEEGYGSKADIWSVGCVIVEMVTGSHPYSELNQFGAIFQISQGHRPPYEADHMSQEGQEFLDLCFRVNPQQRPSAEELLQHPFLTGIPTS